MEAAKKQRIPRNQKNKRKETETQANTVLVEDKSSNPQPQRVNRRQRNEPSPSVTNVVTPAPAVEVAEKKESTEVVIDHSNLKRETEEIAKLKKKFTKREITSNWNRYTAPEDVEGIKQTEEEDGPADFSDLLQVPVSRGGHLQLKEEKDWSKASGAELSGYFALDLKQLSLSLACVPLHEQLLLPKHLLTEEEIRHFDALANQSKACYKPDKIGNPNSKVLKQMLNLVTTEIVIEEAPSLKEAINKEKTFNILDIEKSKEILLNIGNEPEEPSNSLCNNDNVILNPIESINLSFPSESKLIEERKEAPENEDNVTEPNIDKIMQAETLNSLKDDFVNNPTINHSSEKQQIINECVPNNEFKDSYTKPYENIPSQSTGILNESSTPDIASTEKEFKDLDEENIRVGNINILKKNTGESKEKRAQRNSTRISPTNDINTKKTCLSEKAMKITLEEDDDLDFLLSLKNPVPSQTKKGSKPAKIKDSSFLPGSTMVSQTATKEQHSELDDWLDSVLQD